MFGKLFGKSGKPGRKTTDAGKSDVAKTRVNPENSAGMRLEPKRGRVESAATEEMAHRPPNELNADDIRAIQEALSAARTETLESAGPRKPDSQSGTLRPPQPVESPLTETAGAKAPHSKENRAQLIRTAMTVYKHKQAALSDLGPREREKLRSLAEEMLGVDPSRDDPYRQ